MVTKTELTQVYSTLYAMGLPKNCQPRTGLMYIMWLILQNQQVYVNGFDIDGTDSKTHEYEKTVKISDGHDAREEGKVLKSLISNGLITRL
jgi:hypothetical protein